MWRRPGGDAVAYGGDREELKMDGEERNVEAGKDGM